MPSFRAIQYPGRNFSLNISEVLGGSSVLLSTHTNAPTASVQVTAPMTSLRNTQEEEGAKEEYAAAMGEDSKMTPLDEMTGSRSGGGMPCGWNGRAVDGGEEGIRVVGAMDNMVVAASLPEGETAQRSSAGGHAGAQEVPAASSEGMSEVPASSAASPATTPASPATTRASPATTPLYIFHWPPLLGFRRAAESADLPLFGRSDHCVGGEIGGQTTEKEASSSLQPPRMAPASSSISDPKMADAGATRRASWLTRSIELTLRAGFLTIIFTPFLLVGVPMLLASSWLNHSGHRDLSLWTRKLAWQALLFGCRNAGAATIKARSRPSCTDLPGHQNIRLVHTPLSCSGVSGRRPGRTSSLRTSATLSQPFMIGPQHTDLSM